MSGTSKVQRVLAFLACAMTLRLLYSAAFGLNEYFFDQSFTKSTIYGFANDSFDFWYNNLCIFAPVFVYLWSRRCTLRWAKFLSPLFGIVSLIEILLFLIVLPFAYSQRKDDDVLIHQVSVGDRMVQATRGGNPCDIRVEERKDIAWLFSARRVLVWKDKCADVEIVPKGADHVEIHFESSVFGEKIAPENFELKL